MRTRPLASVIGTSCVLVWLALTGCQEQNPYIREVLPAYNEHGERMVGYYTLPKPYMEHMLKDLEFCYRQDLQ